MFITRGFDAPPAPLLRFVFESDAGGTYVDPLANPANLEGLIATQNAGSTNPGLYYRVDTSANGTGGLNAIFGDALSASGQLDQANQRLADAYDLIYGESAHHDDSASPPSPLPLTSLLVRLDADSAVADEVAAMVYSVGPVLGPNGIVDEDQYRQIYYDAYDAVAGYNYGRIKPIVGLRIAMLSTGVYASRVNDADLLFKTAATNIIRGIAKGASDFGIRSPGLTVLINTDTGATPNQRTAFSAAAADLGLVINNDHFEVDPNALEA